MTFSDGMCGPCAIRARKEWGLPAVPAGEIEERRRTWGPAFPFATAVLATSIVIVAVGLVTSASGPGSRGKSAQVARVPLADPAPVAPRATPAAPHAASGDVSQQVVRAQEIDATRGAGSSFARATDRVRPATRPVARRATVVRVKDRRAIGEFDETEVQPVAAPVIVGPPVSAAIVFNEPIPAHPLAAPRIVEVQAP